MLWMVIFACDVFGNKFQSFPTSIGEGLCVSSDVNNWQHPVRNTGYLDVGENMCMTWTSISLLLCDTGTLRWERKNIDILQSRTIWTKNRIVMIKDHNGCEFKVFFCSNTVFVCWVFQSLHHQKNHPKLMVCRCISFFQVDIWQVPC